MIRSFLGEQESGRASRVKNGVARVGSGSKMSRATPFVGTAGLPQ